MQALWKTVWRFLKKLKIELPYNPAVPLLDIYAKINEPKCPLIDEWIKKTSLSLSHTHTHTHTHTHARTHTEE